MRNFDYVVPANIHDLTMFILERTNFSGQSIPDLTNQISDTYVDVYNQLIQKYTPLRQKAEQDDIVPVGLESQPPVQ